MTIVPDPPAPLTVLDPAQLDRIEIMHRGFLYQHLYAVQCLLTAAVVGATAVAVEGDEDVELIFPDRRAYLQVKHRLNSLAGSDVDEALERFVALRKAHAAGERPGSSQFFIVSTSTPNGPLAARMSAPDWPADVRILWPGCGVRGDDVPQPPPSLLDAFAAACGLAATLPFAMLTPETLVWKLAGLVTLAATGQDKTLNHVFDTSALPGLFEQMVFQLQDLPAPPSPYRIQAQEPDLTSDDRVRLIVGHSGAGKTSWVAQAAQHARGAVVYLDVIDTPAPNLTNTVAREVASRLFGGGGGRLGEVLIPGASGRDILLGIGRRLAETRTQAVLVLDNAHVVGADALTSLIQATAPMSVVLLCRPDSDLQLVEALTGVRREVLGGWSPDTIAAEAHDRGCRAGPASAQRLLDLTGGLPLYVQNAMTIAAADYAGSVEDFCRDLALAAQTVDTAQELILGRVFDSFDAPTAEVADLLCLNDIPLKRADLLEYVALAVGRKGQDVTAALRKLQGAGLLQTFAGDRIKIHDAAKVVGKARLLAAGAEPISGYRRALQTVVLKTLRSDWSFAKLALFLRLTRDIGDYEILVEMAADEHFHELGLWPEIEAYIDTVAVDVTVPARQRVVALDGLVFADLKYGPPDKIMARLDLMDRLIADHGLGWEESLRAGMKRMGALATSNDRKGARAQIERLEREMAKAPEAHRRIFRYNAAVARFQLGDLDAAEGELATIVGEYYRLVGLTPQLVMGRNSDALRPLLRKSDTQLDDVKHLADSLDALAKVKDAKGAFSPFERIHALKFYELVQSAESLLRVGQDLVDSFVWHHDFAGARQFMESILLPLLAQYKLADYMVTVRSHYAVVLAYCRAFDEADREMARLQPYVPGLPALQQKELREQTRLIAELRRDGPPPQRPIRAGLPDRFEPMPVPAADRALRSDKIGRNDPCPCGSGRKFKKCCL